MHVLFPKDIDKEAEKLNFAWKPKWNCIDMHRHDAENEDFYISLQPNDFVAWNLR